MVIDQIAARAADDHIRAARAVDRLRPRPARDRVRPRRTQDRDRAAHKARVHVREAAKRRRTRRLLTIGIGQVQIDPGLQHQRVVRTRPAVNGGFGSVVIDEIGARAAGDDVGAAVAVDRVIARAAGDRVGAGRAEQGDVGRHRAGVDIGEARDAGRAGDLVARARQIDVGSRLQNQRRGSAAAVQARLRAVVIDRGGAAARQDDVRAAQAVDRVGPRAARDRVGAARTHDRGRARHPARIDVLEVRQRRPARHRLIGDMRQVDVHRRVQNQRVGSPHAAVQARLRAVVIYKVRTRAADHDIRAAVAVDRVVPRTARDRVRQRRAQDRNRRRRAARVHIDEARHHRRSRHLLARIGQVHIRRHVQIQRRAAGSAVDRRFRAVVINQIRARTGVDHVRPAVAVDRLRARAARDRVRSRRAQDRDVVRYRARVHIREAGHRRRAGRLMGRIGQVHIRARVEIQRRDAAAAADRGFRPVVIDEIRARPGVDHVRPAVAVDRLRARTARDRVRRRRAQDRDRARHRARVHIREALQDRGARCRLIGRIGQVQRSRRLQHQRVGRPRARVDRGLGVVEVDRVRARAAHDHIVAARAVDRVVPRTARDRVRRRRAQDRDRAAHRMRVHIREPRHQSRAARLVRRARQIDVRRRVQNQRRHARARRDRDFPAVIIDQVRARTPEDDVRAPVPVDRVRPKPARDRVRPTRTQ